MKKFTCEHCGRVYDDGVLACTSDDCPGNGHYFASFGLGWATAATRDEVVNKLVDGFRSDVKRMTANIHKDGGLGAYIWTCKVNAAEDAKYSIEYYMPKGVDISDAKEHYITYVSAKKVAYHTPAGMEYATK